MIPENLKDTVFVYLNDLSVISETFDLHISLLSQIVSLLRQAGLFINVAKSKQCVASLYASTRVYIASYKEIIFVKIRIFNLKTL